MIQLDKSGSRVRKMFEEIAPRYDLMNHVLSLGIDISWRKRTVRELRLDGVEPILDCCTGTGDLALMIARHVGNRARVIGTDFCLPMLTRAETKKHSLDGSSGEPVEFLEADTQALPFPDAMFQAVTVAFGLRNVEDTDQGLREMTRVCKPGGQVAVLEFSKPTVPDSAMRMQPTLNMCYRESVNRWLATDMAPTNTCPTVSLSFHAVKR